MRRIRIGTILFIGFFVVSALFLTGCGNSQKMESLEYQNQVLKERVAELEEQLAQSESAAAVQAPETPTPMVHSVYVVVEGDNLWSIAKKQLGSGTRYKEILDLNPQISKDQPLAIGTKLILPAAR